MLRSFGLLLGLLLVSPTLLAASDEKLIHRIAFGSCALESAEQPIWEKIVATKPNLFLFIGDNIYGDTEDMKVLAAKYQKLANQPGYQKLQKTCPIFATWDDHDYGVNDGGAEYPKRKESQQVFMDFFGIPKNSTMRKREGVYDAHYFGPKGKCVQVILLDTRYFRSTLKKRQKYDRNLGPYVPNEDEQATMLGEAQWQWLEGELKKPADLRIIASSIQVIPQDHGWEKWYNMPAERDRLFNLIKATKAEGVVFISGDRHLAELSQMNGGVGYPLYDLTSSGLNRGAKGWRPLEPNQHRVATMNYGDNFGLITVDWAQKDPVVSLQIRDVEGDIRIRQKLPLSVLQTGTLKSVVNNVVTLASGKRLTPELFAAKLGEKATVRLSVASTGKSQSKGLIFLNSASDFKSPENFTVVLTVEVQKQLQDSGLVDLRKHFQGKRIEVTGVFSRYNDDPQIIVEKAAQIRIGE